MRDTFAPLALPRAPLLASLVASPLRISWGTIPRPIRGLVLLGAVNILFTDVGSYHFNGLGQFPFGGNDCDVMGVASKALRTFRLHSFNVDG